jgi:hypothetical protein
MATAEGILQDEEEDTASEQTHELVDLSLQLRLMLGRRLILALIAPPGGADDAFTNLAARLSAYPEVTSLVILPHSTKPDEAERVVDEAARVDTDAVLVTLASGSPTTQLEDSASVPSLKWPRDVLRVADRYGLRERAFCGLIGESVTRDSARRLGFEDGFAIAIAAHDLVAYLAQDALRREQHRRQGSSPPCYL